MGLKRVVMAVLCGMLSSCNGLTQAVAFDGGGVIRQEWAQAIRPIPDDPLGDGVEPDVTTGMDRIMTLRGAFGLFEVLQSAARVAGRNLVIGQGVKDSGITLDLAQAPVSRVLETALYPSGYGFRVREKDLVVLAVETRVFAVTVPPVEQSLDSLTTNESLNGTPEDVSTSSRASGKVKVGTKVVTRSQVASVSFWVDIEKNVRGLLSSSGSMTLNKAGGSIIVTDTPAALRLVDGLMRSMNERASRQILADVRVVEVTLSDENRLGIDWNSLMETGALKDLRASTDFVKTLDSSQGVFVLSGAVNKAGSGNTETGANVLLRALNGYGQVEVVSQPRVALLNNSVANIQVGQTRAYVETSNVETTQSGGTIVTGTLGEVHGGVTLQIIGSITGDTVCLNVTPVVSSIDDIRSVQLGGGARLEAPETSMRSMNAMVRLKQGQTAVIGGLIARDTSVSHRGVPFLDRIPFLGKAFSYDVKSRRRVELVVMITPRKG